MPTDPDCVFCKIISGAIPSHKIYEDEAVFVILDVNPVVKGHTLVLSKQHYPTLMEIPGGLLSAMHRRMPALTRAVLAGTGAKGCHVLVNNGSDAKQTVPHVHYHILPRNADDGFSIPWKTQQLDAAEAAPLAAAMTSAAKFQQ